MSISTGSVAAGPSFLDGIPAAAAALILERLERRRFPPGSVVIEEGDLPRRIYFTESGEAEVEIADQPIGRIRAGTTIGEMSLFTGLPASASVRAVDELVVRVISEPELERIGLEHPQVFRNLAALLADRLA
jgi:CRP-like cAMP-binding protein